MARDYKKLDKELTQKIETVIKDGDITKSRERQKVAENLIRQQQAFRKKNKDRFR